MVAELLVNPGSLPPSDYTGVLILAKRLPKGRLDA